MIANPAAFAFTGTVLTSQNPGSGYAFSTEDPEHAFLDRLLGPPVDRQRVCAALAGLGVRYVALAKVADWRDFARVADAPGMRLVYSSPSLDLFSVRATAEETRDERRVRSIDLVDYRVLPGHPGVVALPVPYSPGWVLNGHPAVRLADGKRVSLRPQGEVSLITARPVAFSLARSGLSWRLWRSEESHSSSGEGGYVPVLGRILGRW